MAHPVVDEEERMAYPVVDEKERTAHSVEHKEMRVHSVVGFVQETLADS